MKSHKECQSCGMPLKMDKKGGGTEKDGAVSKMYCSFCYQHGEFTKPDMTAEEMKQRVSNMLKEKTKLPSMVRRFITRKIPKLARRKK